MSETKRKVHGAQFKAKIGLEALRETKTVNEIVQENGVHPGQVGQWKREIQERASVLFEGKRGPTKKVDGCSDPERLYGEIGRLKLVLSLSKGWNWTG